MTSSHKSETSWSEEIPGDIGNWEWPVSFSVTDGYLRIYQNRESEKEASIVLLSPAQVAFMMKFYRKPHD